MFYLEFDKFDIKIIKRRGGVIFYYLNRKGWKKC